MGVITSALTTSKSCCGHQMDKGVNVFSMKEKTMKYERLAGLTKDRLNFITSASFSKVPLLTPSTFSRNMDPVWKEAICGPQKNVR